MLSSILHSRNFLHVSGAPLGALKTNCYLLHHGKNKIMVIDPGEKLDGFIEYLDALHKHIKEVNIFLTHGHWNHIVGVPQICAAFPKAKIYANLKDLKLFTSAKYNLSDKTNHPFNLEKYMEKFIFIKDGDVLPLKNHLSEKAGSSEKVENSEDDGDKISVIETPGHTPGSCALKVENKEYKLLFTGDTLYEGSVGFCDNLLGNYPLMMDSIMKKLYPLSDEFIIFPGHGDQSQMGIEKKMNPLIQYELKKNNSKIDFFI